MADERLIFEIGFDLDGAVQVAIKDGKKAITKIQKELRETPIQLDVNTKSLRAELKKLNDEWNKLSASQRAGVEGTKLREQYRALTTAANGYTSTLRSAVSAEDRATAAKQRAANATERQNAAYKTQSTYLSRLAQRMVAYASVAQAFGFLRNVKEVTAEFELQRVALGALLQDAYKANALFEQIKVQAVKSPFEVKDLVSYTKQLAAYGVEADDLMGTMNRLADISAGLGTDMNRIILAYGQIQAAGVLKGTELRQLTELGIPMVDLLAEYYSTLRNEVVTTSEVFDMISKKEIPFQAVQDILEDLTSEGGRFFNMQAKQAETLAGQWSNLKDTLSIMYDEIGRTEEVRAMMEGWINVVKYMAINWRQMAQAIAAVGTTLAILKAKAGVVNLLAVATRNLASVEALEAKAEQAWKVYADNNTRSLRLSVHAKRLSAKWTLTLANAELAAAKATKAWERNLRMLQVAMMKNWVGILIAVAGAITSLVLAFRKSRSEMDAFRDSMRDAVKESVQNADMMAYNFKRLAKEVATSADGSYKQQEALRRLKQQFGDIFPDFKLTVEYLKEMYEAGGQTSDAFDNMTNSIKEFTSVKMRQQLIESYQSKLQDQFVDTFEQLTDTHGDNFASVIGFIEQEVENYENERDLLMEVYKKFLKVTGHKDVMVWDDKGIYLQNERTKYVTIEQLIRSGREINNIILDLNKNKTEQQSDALVLLFRLVHALYNANGEINAMMESFDALDPKTKRINDRISTLKTTLEEIRTTTGGETAEEVNKQIEAETKEKLNEALRNLLLEEGVWYLDMKKVDIKNIDSLISDIKRISGDALPDAFYDGLEQIKAIAGGYSEVWKRELADMQGYLDEGTQFVQVFSVDQINGFTTLSQAVTSVADKYKELKKQQEMLSKLKASGGLDPQESAKTEAALANVNFQMAELLAFLEKYGMLHLVEEKKTNPRIALLNDELSTVEKIYKEYQELSKYMSDEDARAMVAKMFEGVNLTMLSQALSPAEMRAQLQKALDEAKKMGDKKQILELEYMLGKFDADESQREWEKSIKDLSDKISRTKTAKEFFDRMLGMTGDKELSATLTMSVYGTTGDDLQKLMTQQVTDAFKNLPKGFDINKAMLDGGKFDYNLLDSWIEHLPKDQQQNAQSIVDNWRKANADILYDLQKSYEDYMTYEERKTRVAEKYSAERKKIMESEYGDDEKKILVKASQKRQDKELADIAIEEFKASEDWAKSFEDLENLATPTIERLMAKLKEFIDTQEDLTPEQLKTLTNEYKKLYDGLIQRNPFQAITDSIKEYQTAMQGIKLAKEQLSAAQAIGDEDLIAFAERELTNAFDDAQEATNKLKKGVDAVGDQFSQAASDIQFFANALGFSEDSYATQFLNGMANAFKGVSIAIGFADIAMKIFDGTIKGMLASNPIGWILLAVSAIISAVQAIMNARINRINKEIETLEDKLDNLEYAYDRLQKSAERAFGTEYIQNYQRQLDNLEAQVEAYEKQLEAERSKGKKADEDKIKEYQEQIRDTKDAIEDMYGSLSEHFLGTDLTSAARDFASAWIDAYKEFANTTDAMKEKFQDMIQNMIVESLIAKVMERALKPVFDMVDKMGDSDFYSNSFWSQLMTEMNKATENGVVGAQNIMGMLESIGINLRDTGTGLTGISKDIATASEESILGLAAGINTQNFYISQVPTKLDTIIGLLRGGSAVVDSGVNVQDLITIQNQFLSNLPTIAQNTAETVAECKAIVAETRRTADALERVIKPQGTQSTHSVNVTIGS